MIKIKTILIDDEQNAISSLLYELNEIAEIEVVACFTDASKAAIFIKNEPLDLAFLDIHMPKLSGIDFLKMYPNRAFEVIFTTAHIEHAFEAYKNEIIDYLLKPISLEEIKNALKKYDKKVKERKIIQEFEELKISKNITLNLGAKERSLQIDEILYCKADGNYTHLFLNSGEHLFVTQKIKFFEGLLGKSFYRIHKSYIINMNQIYFFDKKNNLVHLKGISPLPISRLKRTEFLQLYKKRSS